MNFSTSVCICSILFDDNRKFPLIFLFSYITHITFCQSVKNKPFFISSCVKRTCTLTLDRLYSVYFRCEWFCTLVFSDALYLITMSNKKNITIISDHLVSQTIRFVLSFYSSFLSIKIILSHTQNLQLTK